MINNSTGEAILAEKDVNEYFRKNENPEGFSDLEFDFGRNGFTAAGSAEGVETTLGAFQLTFFTIGIMAMLAAAIFLQLAPTDGRRARRPEEHVES